jgi:hypothetical protein
MYQVLVQECRGGALVVQPGYRINRRQTGEPDAALRVLEERPIGPEKVEKDALDHERRRQIRGNAYRPRWPELDHHRHPGERERDQGEGPQAPPERERPIVL